MRGRGEPGDAGDRVEEDYLLEFDPLCDEELLYDLGRPVDNEIDPLLAAVLDKMPQEQDVEMGAEPLADGEEDKMVLLGFEER